MTSFSIEWALIGIFLCRILKKKTTEVQENWISDILRSTQQAPFSNNYQARPRDHDPIFSWFDQTPIVLRLAPTWGTFSISIVHVRHINIIKWLQGFQDKLLYLVLLISESFLGTKGALQICHFDPKNSEPCQNIDRSTVACFPRNKSELLGIRQTCQTGNFQNPC